MRELLETIYKPIGIPIRIFVIDYQDIYKRNFNQECALPDYGDESCIQGIISMLAIRGLTAICIYEILHGYTAAQLSKMKPDTFSKHLRVIYVAPERTKYESR